MAAARQASFVAGALARQATRRKSSQLDLSPRFVGLLDIGRKKLPTISPQEFHNRFFLPNPVHFHRVGPRRVSRQRSVVERAHLVLGDPNSCRLASYATALVMAIILLSCVNFIVATSPFLVEYSPECKVCEPLSGSDRQNSTLVAERAARECAHCEPSPPAVLDTVEAVCIAIFTVEYLARLVTAHAVPEAREFPTSPPVTMPTSRPCSLRQAAERTRAFATSPMNLVDLVAIAPFYLTLVVPSGPGSLAVLRVLRLLRVFRVLKVGGLADGVQLFSDVARKSDAFFRVFLVFSLFATVVFASLVFFAEMGSWDTGTGEFVVEDPLTRAKQPSPFTSILLSGWWTMVTFTVVGYGDMFPVTPFGHVVGSVAMYVGVVLLAIPVTIMGYNLGVSYQQQLLSREKADERSHLFYRAVILMCQRRQASLQRAFNTWQHVALGNDTVREIALWEISTVAIQCGLARPSASNIAASALSGAHKGKPHEGKGADADNDADPWQPVRTTTDQTRVLIEAEMDRQRRVRQRLISARLGTRVPRILTSQTNLTRLDIG